MKRQQSFPTRNYALSNPRYDLNKANSYPAICGRVDVKLFTFRHALNSPFPPLFRLRRVTILCRVKERHAPLGTLQITADGSEVTMGFNARSRTDKKQHYTFTATVDPAPTHWNPLENWDPSDPTPPEWSRTLSLGSWDILGSNGPVSKSAHAPSRWC